MNAKTAFTTSFALAAALAAPCRAALVPVSPVGGTTVAIVPDAQKKAMSGQTLDDRIRNFADCAESGSSGKDRPHGEPWRKAKPLVLKWRTTEGEGGPWKIEIDKRQDLSDARVWYVRTGKTDKVSGRDVSKSGDGTDDGEVAYTVPRANLESNCEYFWRITARGRCGLFNCNPKCGCKESKRKAVSPIASFRTEDAVPRWIAIEGEVHNMRDLGGWRAAGGRRVRQGLIYRGQGLNDNSVTGEHRGRNRLTMEDAKYLTGTLGIRTDLDLRSKGETADLSESPLGNGVAFVHRSSWAYRDIFGNDGKKTMAKNFRLFCNRENYPVYMHCIGGADRTGSLAYVMLGVLGVDRHDMEVEWESTFYPKIPDSDPNMDRWCRESHFNVGFSKYGKEGDSWNRRVELYLLDCGVTEAEIEAFRSIMLEP